MILPEFQRIKEVILYAKEFTPFKCDFLILQRQLTHTSKNDTCKSPNPTTKQRSSNFGSPKSTE